MIKFLILLFFSASALAQQYPTKPVKVYLHFPAGGSTDVVTRILSNALGEAMGQPGAVGGGRPGAHNGHARPRQPIQVAATPEAGGANLKSPTAGGLDAAAAFVDRIQHPGLHHALGASSLGAGAGGIGCAQRNSVPHGGSRVGSRSVLRQVQS